MDKKKKKGSINAFVIVAGVIVACWILSFFISPGAFERQVLNGRTVVIANSFHPVDKIYLGPQALFQAIPNGLVSSSGMMFLVMLVAGCIEVYKRTGTLDKAMAGVLAKSDTVGSEKILIAIMIIFGCLGGFLGWNEQIVPFIPIVISLCIALGYDLMTGLASSTGIAAPVLFACTVLGAQSSAISPFSSGGSLILGSSPKEEDRNELFNRLLLIAVPTSVICCALFNFVVAFIF